MKFELFDSRLCIDGFGCEYLVRVCLFMWVLCVCSVCLCVLGVCVLCVYHVCVSCVCVCIVLPFFV